MKTSASIATILILLLALAAEAKIVHYFDDDGKIHYVNTDFSKVPDRYLPQVRPQLADEQPDKVLDAPSNNAVLPPEEPAVKTKTPGSRGGGEVEFFFDIRCPDCKKVEDLLQSLKIRYARFNVSRHPYGINFYRQESGDLPIIRAQGKVIHGADMDGIKKFLIGEDEPKK
ncbi:MAG: glutaredoxin domain-containing protein [Candidatus Omnitrophota bacterium]|nr:glutaredoxin domain-containing protein [Candidatus Omnitrophota bacterium]MDZ4242645.1 glutaredoxin domain-containing protein [Candidatus Omnitrophota bacterium]